MKLDKNNPKLTAYALGELNDEERIAIEQELEAHPELKDYVDEIRAVSADLNQHYAQDSEIGLTEEQRQTIFDAARSVRKAKPFPVRPWKSMMAAAAIFVALIFMSGSFVVFKVIEKSEVKFSASAPIYRPKMTLRKPKVKVSKSTRVAYAKPRTGPKLNRNIASMSEYELPELSGMGGGLDGGSIGGYELQPDISDMGILGGSERLSHESTANEYAEIVENNFLRVRNEPLSTFSIDVDTASYSQVRSFLGCGMLPPHDAVRIEELVNYFNYSYAPPIDDVPFATHLEMATCPWAPQHKLVRIGLKGRVIEQAERPALNLVFLLDVSGSMNDENKLPLLKRSLEILVKQLDRRDRVSIVVYAGASGLVLPPTSGTNSKAILRALKKLESGGGTNGGEGIELAYKVAAKNFHQDGVNRVILCTDGDFNIGTTQRGDLNRLIEEKAKGGVFLSVLGFGMGNYKDEVVEQLADRGNGNYAYIDTFSEARKVLVDQMTGTLVTIAKDVKIQVEFNPTQVAGYRLIGYENRMLATEDFNDDQKDAGEIGAGHTVTALYEIIPVGQPVNDVPAVDGLKYQSVIRSDTGDELLTVKLRYKEPTGDTSRKLEFPLRPSDQSFAAASDDFRFAASVAGFGMLLRDSECKGDWTYEEVINAAKESLGADAYGYRRECIDLMRNAKALSSQK